LHLKILIRPTRTVDGVSLDSLRVGQVYDLGTEVACVLLAEGWADLVSSSGRGVFPPPPRVHATRHLVMVVDDDARVRTMAEAILTTQGYHVVGAAHGRQAIERLRECCPALIVLDLDMPVMDGWQFRGEQRRLADRARAAVPILLMTGVDDPARHADQLQASGVVQKPFHPDELLARVSAAIAGGSSKRRSRWNSA
jgi:CheY-like chemotaxis protein